MTLYKILLLVSLTGMSKQDPCTKTWLGSLPNLFGRNKQIEIFMKIHMHTPYIMHYGAAITYVVVIYTGNLDKARLSIAISLSCFPCEGAPWRDSMWMRSFVNWLAVVTVWEWWYNPAFCLEIDWICAVGQNLNDNEICTV